MLDLPPYGSSGIAAYRFKSNIHCNRYPPRHIVLMRPGLR